MRALKQLALILGLGLAATPAWAAFIPSAAQGQVLNFGINTSLILELYNRAQQTNGQLTSWPADLNPAVVQATVRNIGTGDGPLCFQVVLREQNTACTGSTVVWSPIISTKAAVKLNETKTLTAADFELSSNGGGGNFCQAFQDEIEKDFKDIDPSNLQKTVDLFLKRQFRVCLIPVDCSLSSSSTSPNADNGKGSCSLFTLFQPNPGAQASVGMIIYPHNNAVPDCNLNFLWTPALYPGLGANGIYYTLEILEDAGGTAGETVARVDVPAGQTYYTWSAKDRALIPGKKYWWRVIARKAVNGAPFGGPDGRGWNIQKWFVCGKDESQACHYSLADLDKYVQEHAKPEVRDALKGFLIRGIREGRLDDPAVCRLLSGRARLESIDVTKK